MMFGFMFVLTLRLCFLWILLGAVSWCLLGLLLFILVDCIEFCVCLCCDYVCVVNVLVLQLF